MIIPKEQIEALKYFGGRHPDGNKITFSPDYQLGWNAAVDHLAAQGRIVPDGWVAVPIDMVASLLWRVDYPKGGSMVRVWEDNNYQDMELYRKEAEALIAAAQKESE